MMSDTALVSREALAEPGFVPRRYRSGCRTAKAKRTWQAIVEAALALIAEGNFRPTLSQVAERAMVGRNRINDHFGYIHLLYRVLARERSEAVAEAAGLGGLPEAEQKRLVWLIMTGGAP
jgi:hypothetical protein